MLFFYDQQSEKNNLFFISTFLRQHAGTLVSTVAPRQGVSGFELANGPGHFYAFLCP